MTQACEGSGVLPWRLLSKYKFIDQRCSGSVGDELYADMRKNQALNAQQKNNCRGSEANFGIFNLTFLPYDIVYFEISPLTIHCQHMNIETAHRNQDF